jgi:chromate transport protein ChrA
MAVIGIAASRLALTNRRDRRLWTVSLVLTAVTTLTGAEIALLFIAAGLLMVILDAPRAGYGVVPGYPQPAAGLFGAIVATVAIFTPVFLGVVVPGPWFIRHRDNLQIQAFVQGATAAAAGAVAAW